MKVKALLKCWLTRKTQLRPISFAVTVGDVKLEGLVITLHHSILEVQVKKAGNTMRDMEAKALVDRLAEVKAGKVVHRLTDLKAASPVITLAPTLAEIEAK